MFAIKPGNRTTRAILCFAMSLLTGAMSAAAAAKCDGLALGQQLAFFPAPASLAANGQWSVTVQGRVFEPTEHSRAREALVRVLAPLIPADAGDPVFRERARYFLSDSEKGRCITVTLGKREFVLPASDSAGFFSANLLLPADEVAQIAANGVIRVTAENGGDQPFSGSVTLVPEQGLTVISDVDDTIKITDIRNSREKKANTFARPFRAVPGMAERYRAWQDTLGANIHFHVVSAGPWQLNQPLRTFTDEAGFPAFTWDMRSVDIGNAAVLLREANPNLQLTYQFKLARIRAMMARFPLRHFVLVGDSGERDPEVYAAILAEFADRVDAVFIRNVTGEKASAGRFRRLFPNPSAAAKLQVFDDPQELPLLSYPATAR